MKTQNTMAIFGVVKGSGEKSYWTRIGTAYANRDGSYNLRLHYVPASFADATLQLRPIDARDEAAEPAVSAT